MVEIIPGVHRIESTYQGRLLTSYLLVGKQSLLVDSGFAFSPEETILPYLEQVNVPVARICWLVVTHASADHCGGNHAMKEFAPRVCIVAHQLDAGSIASHATFMRNHVDCLREAGIPLAGVREDDAEFLRQCGVETRVDWGVRGGEELIVDGGWSVALVHVPGHTPGHIAVLDRKNGILFSGDAVMGRGIPDASGNLVMPPHYFEVDSYRSTIGKIRGMAPRTILATHFSPIVGEAVEQFLHASEEFVQDLEAAIMGILRRAGGALHIRSVIDETRNVVGIPDSEYQYGLLVVAHLQLLAQRGRVFLLRGHCWTLEEKPEPEPIG